MMTSYNFPVSLQELYTKNGAVAPRVQAVVRDDTQEPLAVVGKRYKLIPHSDVINQARMFVSALGEPTETFSVGRKGAVLLGTFTYREHRLQVAKGDMVGLRVHIENSYNATRSVSVRIGALVLSCLNGMVTPRNIYHYVWRHTTSAHIEFPHPDEILHNFTQESLRWRNYGDVLLADRVEQFTAAINNLPAVLGESMTNAVIHELNKTRPATVWDLMQACTYQITHTSKASMLGKIQKLDRVAKLVDELVTVG